MHPRMTWFAECEVAMECGAENYVIWFKLADINGRSHENMEWLPLRTGTNSHRD